jgi:hypothetical protein
MTGPTDRLADSARQRKSFLGDVQQLSVSDSGQVHAFEIRRMLLQLDQQAAAICQRLSPDSGDGARLPNAEQSPLDLSISQFIVRVGQLRWDAAFQFSDFAAQIGISFFFRHTFGFFGVGFRFFISVRFLLRGLFFGIGFGFRLFRFFCLSISLFFLGCLFGIGLGLASFSESALAMRASMPY